MDLRQLTALVTVAEVGSVSRAAKLLHLVQPAVTRQIRSLEEELGVRLFERTRTGMVPTEQGQLLIERARRALREIERGRAEVTPDRPEVSGSVTLGVLESAVDLVVAPLVDRVATKYPGVTLRVLTAYSGHLQAWMDDGDVDVSLLYNLAPTPSVSVLPLLDEQLWAVAPAGAGLAPDAPVPWSSLWERPLVLPVPGHGLRALIDRARAETAAQPEVVVEVNSLRLQKLLVTADRGWTALPASAVAPDVERGTLSGAPLVDPIISRSMVLAFPRVTRLAPPVAAVASELQTVIRRQVEVGDWPGTMPVMET